MLSIGYDHRAASIVCSGTVRLRAAVVFHRGADDAAGVGDEIGNHQRACFVEEPFGFRGERNVSSLRYELGFQARHVVFADHVRARGGNPNLAFDIDHRIGISFCPSG